MTSSPSTSSFAELTTPPDIDMGGTPTVALDGPNIDHAMAARLTVALLGHMLYMKGQVPFPVQSIAQMSQHKDAETTGESRTAMRMARKRVDFLESWDDLKSHLHTTFVALSTALAFNESRYPSAPMSISSSSVRPPAKVHVFLILGSSPSSAKMRLLLELDGLRIEKFGERDFLLRERERSEVDGRDEDYESDGSDEDSIASEYAARTDTGDVPAVYSPPRAPPPILRHAAFPLPSQTYALSHSPVSSSHSSRAESPPPASSSIHSLSDAEEFSDYQARRSDSTNTLALAQRAEEVALRAGERLLSRVLFAAGEGLGFGDEISPTQAHVLIRAPRRFAHPTWVPRESLGGTLDRHVRRFLDTESCEAREGGLARKGEFGTGVRTAGVRVTCRGTESLADNTPNSCETTRHEGGGSEQEAGDVDEDEGDELIWWSWDGKLVGFAD